MKGAMIFADFELAKRLERAEGFACVQFAAARKNAFPECNSDWMRCAGADVVFDGVDAPTTQTFGLGLFEELTPGAMDEIERFFSERGAAVMHEVSPLAGVATFDLLAVRGYRPIEISNVLFRTVENPESTERDDIRVRVIAADEAELWAAVSARGWTHEHPELKEFVEQMGVLMVGGLSLYEGVALFAGAATVPEMRRRGLQGALLEARMRYALEHGCDLAMMVAEAGSESQRNAERQGFRVAYTRMKWKVIK